MPSKVVKKFHHDGSSKTYLGHSLVCPLPCNSDLAATLKNLRKGLSEHRLSFLFNNEALLPDSSWHMTVFICIRDQERAEDVMPRDGYAANLKNDVGLTGPYNDWLLYTIKQVEGLELKPDARPPYRLVIDKNVPRIRYSIALRLHPTTDSLLKLRDQLAQQTGIKHTNHDSFAFHITLAYLLREPTQVKAEELGNFVEHYLENGPAEVEFRTVSLCAFEDMQRFNTRVVVWTSTT